MALKVYKNIFLSFEENIAILIVFIVLTKIKRTLVKIQGSFFYLLINGYKL